MKKSYLATATALALSMMSCGNQASNTEAQATDSTAMTEVMTETPSYLATYEGTLPCADCPGIKTTLTLNADGTYDLTTVEGENVDPINENGTYMLEGEVVTLVTPSSGNKTYYRLLPQEGNIALAQDSLGTLSDGELAPYYILKRK